MDILESILAELKSPSIATFNTVINDNDCAFTVYQVMPCSSDIYCVFQNPKTKELYALQNTGAAFWIKWSNGLEPDKYFLLPVTSYLIQDREGCMNTFYKWCRQSELGDIPIVKEEFVNPFTPITA